MTKFQFRKDAVTAVATKVSKYKGHLLLSHSDQTIEETPEVKISFSDVAEVDFTIRSLKRLRGQMLSAGLPSTPTQLGNPIAEFERLMKKSGKPTPFSMVDLIMQIGGKDNGNQTRKKEQQH